MSRKQAVGFVDKDKFLTELAAAFESTKELGSIWITHKRLTYDGTPDTPMAPPAGETDTKEYPCIIKVTDGKKFKMSTHITSSEIEKFHGVYGALLKQSMSTLKKRDKKKEKSRLEKALLRRKKLVEKIEIIGPRNGAGRRKRQRRVKAVVKQAEALKKTKERDEARAKRVAGSSNV